MDTYLSTISSTYLLKFFKSLHYRAHHSAHITHAMMWREVMWPIYLPIHFSSFKFKRAR